MVSTDTMKKKQKCRTYIHIKDTDLFMSSILKNSVIWYWFLKNTRKNDDFYDIMLDDGNAKRQDISGNYIDLLRTLLHTFQ